MRMIAAATVTAALVLAGLQPSAAATTPGSVGLVSFTAASFSHTDGTAGLTIDWSAASNARSYEIFLSRHYDMSGATRYTRTSSNKTFTKLKAGANYFVQVRGVNGSAVGRKSQRVGHTTIRQMEPANGPTYRVMTYNLCSEKCSSWKSKRQAPALDRIATYQPDVLATQEAVNFTVVPPGYAQAIYKSSKRLLYNTSRLKLVPPPTAPPAKPGNDSDGCSPTWNGVTTGYVFLGYHGSGCRYAVWAVLEDKDVKGKDRALFVDVHTVSGDAESRARQREDEITTLTQQIDQVNSQAQLPVIYAGDFNSHKNRSNDYLRSVFHRLGYYDAYDLALELRRQHYNSYNDFSTVPKISYKWGDHVDHVWIKPDKGRILKWNNGALIEHNRMVTPIPSDHSPLVIDVRLNQ